MPVRRCSVLDFMAIDPVGLEAQAKAVAIAANRLRRIGAELKEAEQTLRLLNRLAILLREHHDDEDALDELSTHLLSVLRLTEGS
jgi:hypothetical protein